MSEPPLVVVMGVSGSGKSTVGSALARLLGVAFVDADSLHPPANIAKMASGTPLADDDRWPWLERVGTVLAEAAGDGLVVACSALKRSYRDAIRSVAPGTRFALLAVDRDELAQRVAHRTDHFMPASLLESQLEALEELGPDEPGTTIGSDGGIDATAARIASMLAL